MLVKASNVTWHTMSPQKQMGLEMTREENAFLVNTKSVNRIC